MLSSVYRLLFPEFKSSNEAKKFSILSLASFFMMGAQWPVKTLKDSLLVFVVGADSQPNMKLASVLFCLGIAVVYGKLVGWFRRETVLYIVTSFLITLGGVFGVLFYLISVDSLPFSASYVVGSFYLYGDAVTVLTIPAFWAFVNDVASPEEAKRGYGLVVLAAQVGALIFTLAGKKLSLIGVPNVLAMSMVLLLVYIGLIYLLVNVVEKRSMRGYVVDEAKVHEKHREAPFLSGLFLIVTSPYVFGILLMTAGQEILTAVLQFKMMKVVEGSLLSQAAVTGFLFDYALVTQTVSCVFSSLGGFFQSTLGVASCITMYPVLVLVCSVLAIEVPTLYVVAGCLALVKGLHYALNKPAREVLYIPTTKDVKYRSKAWIDGFGSRAFKAAGSFICKLPDGLSTAFVVVAPILWVGVSRFIGKQYNDSVKGKERVV